MDSSSVARRTGTFALLAGVLGFVALGLLIAALAAPTPSPNTMRRETNFFFWQNAGVILQALAMIPVTLGIYRLGDQRATARNKRSLGLGLVAQISLAATSGLVFTHTASDMLYMGPLGLVGLWLLQVNRRRDGYLTAGQVWTGRVAALGLLLIGAGFLIYGVFVAPTIFLRPLSNREIDAQTLTPANLISHVCLAAGTLLGRVVYPVWALLLGKRLLQSSNQGSDPGAPVAS